MLFLKRAIDNVISVFGEPNVKEYSRDTEEARNACWRGFDIGEKFRLNIQVTYDKGKEKMTFFSLFFRPFTDNIK